MPKTRIHGGSIGQPQLIRVRHFFHRIQLTALALAVAACRETLEEGCILPTQSPVAADVLGELLRDAQNEGLLETLIRREIVLDVARMAPLARWVTPEAESRRFDARFYLLALPEGQIGKHDEHETTMSMWAKPKDVLDAAAEGRFFLAPPTSRTLELLANEQDVHGAYQTGGPTNSAFRMSGVRGGKPCFHRIAG